MMAADSETSTTTSTRFSQYLVMLAREPASFWRENVVAIVILLRVLATMSKWREQLSYQMLEVGSFCDRERV